MFNFWRHSTEVCPYKNSGDWGLGIGDWGLGPIPNPQSPIPNPQSPLIPKYQSVNECINTYNFPNNAHYAIKGISITNALFINSKEMNVQNFARTGRPDFSRPGRKLGLTQG